IEPSVISLPCHGSLWHPLHPVLLDKGVHCCRCWSCRSLQHLNPDGIRSSQCRSFGWKTGSGANESRLALPTFPPDEIPSSASLVKDNRTFLIPCSLHHASVIGARLAHR